MKCPKCGGKNARKAGSATYADEWVECPDCGFNFELDEIEITILPDPKCKICWGTGKTTQRISTGVPYFKPPPDIHPDTMQELEEAQFIETECDCIVKQNVIKAQKKRLAEKPKIIYNGRELSR